MSPFNFFRSDRRPVVVVTQPIAPPRPRPSSTRARQQTSDFGADRIGCVGFHDQAFVIARPADAFAHWLPERFQALPEKVGGRSTNLASGLDLGLSMLRQTPKGIRRRLWVLSDGMPNNENDRIPALAQQARELWVNINTVQFGDRSSANEEFLRRLAGATHRGQFFQLDNLRELKEALVQGSGGGGRSQRHHRAETTIFCIDLSGSMTGPMEGRRKIDVVVEAMMTLLEYKQRMWS